MVVSRGECNRVKVFAISAFLLLHVGIILGSNDWTAVEDLSADDYYDDSDELWQHIVQHTNNVGHCVEKITTTTPAPHCGTTSTTVTTSIPVTTKIPEVGDTTKTSTPFVTDSTAAEETTAYIITDVTTLGTTVSAFSDLTTEQETIGTALTDATNEMETTAVSSEDGKTTAVSDNTDTTVTIGVQSTTVTVNTPSDSTEIATTSAADTSTLTPADFISTTDNHEVSTTDVPSTGTIITTTEFVSTQLTSTTPFSPNSQCQSSMEAHYMPYPGECSKFILCYKGLAYVFVCPAKLFYNSKLEVCDWQCVMLD